MAAEILHVYDTAEGAVAEDRTAFTVYLPPSLPVEEAQDTVVSSAPWQGALRPPAESYPGFTVTSDTPDVLQARIDGLAAETRRLRIAPVAGLAGLAVTAAAVRYAPHVATNAAQHLERVGMDAAVFSTWGSLGAIFFGSMILQDVRTERNSARTDLKNLRWLMDDGMLQPDTGAYVFKWPGGNRPRRFNRNSRV